MHQFILFLLDVSYRNTNRQARAQAQLSWHGIAKEKAQGEESSITFALPWIPGRAVSLSNLAALADREMERPGWEQ